MSSDDTQTLADQPPASADSTNSGAAATAGGSPLPAAAQRPEVMAGAAFGGAFLVARVLKRLFD